MCGLMALTLVFALEITTFWLKSTKEEMRQARHVRQLKSRTRGGGGGAPDAACTSNQAPSSDYTSSEQKLSEREKRDIKKKQ